MRETLGQAVMVTSMAKRMNWHWARGALFVSPLCLALLGTAPSAVAKPKDDAKKETKKDDAKDDAKPAKAVKHGPIDDIVERYKQARAPKKDQPGMVTLSPDECRGFAKDFLKAADKEKAREVEAIFNAGVVYDQ